MRNPRIALFTGNYNHIRDGVSNTLNRLVAHLELKGYEVLVFGPWAPEPAMSHAGTFVPVYAIPAPGRPEYRISLGFPATEKQKLSDFNPDIIHIATPDILGFRALRYAIRHRIPVVSSFHTHFSSYLKYYRLGFLEPLLWSYLKWFYKHCRQLYVPSPSMMEELREAGVESDLILWTRGVDTGLFHPGQRNHGWRESRGFGTSDVVVLFVSRLVWEKNLHVVVDVIRRLKEEDPSIRTMVVGDGPAKEQMETMLADTVFTGYLEGKELAAAYAGSDLFFFPSDTESFGNVTLEAMSSGLPAVVAEASGSRSLVENGVNGYRTGATDVDSFVSYLLELARDKQKRIDMCDASREKAMAYDWNRILDKLISCYHEVFEKDATKYEKIT